MRKAPTERRFNHDFDDHSQAQLTWIRPWPVRTFGLHQPKHPKLKHFIWAKATMSVSQILAFRTRLLFDPACFKIRQSESGISCLLEHWTALGASATMPARLDDATVDSEPATCACCADAGDNGHDSRSWPFAVQKQFSGMMALIATAALLSDYGEQQCAKPS